MNLLLDIPILKILTGSNTGKFGDPIYDSCYRIFSNKENKFLLSKKYIDLAESNLKTEENEHHVNSFLHEMMDRKHSIEHKKIEEISNIHSEILTCPHFQYQWIS